MTSYKTVLVQGPFGNLGSLVTKELLSHHFSVVALARPGYESDAKKAALAEEFKASGARIVVADLANEEQLRQALNGVDVVVSTTTAFQDQLPVLAAAKAAGVKRFVPSEFSPVDIAGTTEPLNTYKLAVRKAVVDSGLEYTLIHNGGFYEWILVPFSGFDWANNTVTLYGSGDKPILATSTHDIARFIVHSISLPAAANATIQIAGATFTGNELADLIAEAGRPLKRVYIPVEELEKAHKAAAGDAWSSFQAYIKLLLGTTGYNVPVDNDKFGWQPVDNFKEFIVSSVKQIK